MDESPSFYIFFKTSSITISVVCSLTSSLFPFKSNFLTISLSDEKLVTMIESTLSTAIKEWQASHKPVYDFVTDDGVGNTVWVIDCDSTNSEISAIFADIDYLYIHIQHLFLLF